MVRRGIFVNPFEKYQKLEHKRILVSGVFFFVFWVAILGWVFFGVVLESSLEEDITAEQSREEILNVLWFFCAFLLFFAFFFFIVMVVNG